MPLRFAYSNASLQTKPCSQILARKPLQLRGHSRRPPPPPSTTLATAHQHLATRSPTMRNVAAVAIVPPRLPPPARPPPRKYINLFQLFHSPMPPPSGPLEHNRHCRSPLIHLYIYFSRWRWCGREQCLLAVVGPSAQRAGRKCPCCSPSVCAVAFLSIPRARRREIPAPALPHARRQQPEYS